LPIAEAWTTPWRSWTIPTLMDEGSDWSKRKGRQEGRDLLLGPGWSFAKFFNSNLDIGDQND